MSIGFVIGAMVICGLFGLEKLAKVFAVILWIGLTIFHPWLIVVWIGIFCLVNSARR